ncbi:glycosyltransferase family 2 protein [Methylobacterium sp. J-076]|uniref:glycosyltransferase family 2 protein n=1 Tax=Methylobacterium sp. J-076 TaxID=2836655 RepID=UPI001FB97ED4|nr:glycosyltransferase [Methylobacterium sp. J-076]MCJ2015112.1 glycosyltransferase [Methylobacterium sp. J-076]
MSAPGRTTVSVVICTYERPEMLARAIRTARVQDLPPGVEAEIAIVDNAPGGSARETVEAIAREPGMVVRYLAHPVPNISHARNRGVAGTAGDLVVFLDDDEWCEPGWLAALVETARATGADVVFGAVVPDFVDGPPAWDPIGRPHQRLLAAPTGTAMGIRHDSAASGRWIGTGNSLLRRATCLAEDAPFDPALGRSGGEDYDLFVRLSRRGRRMVWCAEAVVHEVVPADRASFAYMLRRNWRGGQQWAVIAVRQAKRPAVTALSVTLRALAQLGLVTLQRLVARDPAILARRRLKVAQVAGKLFWWTMPRGHR